MARPKDIPFSEESESANYAEFSVTKKPDKKIKLRRFLLVLLYVSFAVAYCIVFLVIWQLAPVVAMLPLLILVMWILTWKHTKFEYTYIAERGQLHIYCTNGYGRSKEVFTARIADTLGVFPLGDPDCKQMLDGCSAVSDYSMGSHTEDLYVAVFPENDNKIAVYFTAATKLLSVLRYYGSERVLVTYVSR